MHRINIFFVYLCKCIGLKVLSASSRGVSLAASWEIWCSQFGWMMAFHQRGAEKAKVLDSDFLPLVKEQDVARSVCVAGGKGFVWVNWSREVLFQWQSSVNQC